MTACFRTISTTRSSGTSSPDCMWALASQATDGTQGFTGNVPLILQVKWLEGQKVFPCAPANFLYIESLKTPKDAAWRHVSFENQDTDLTAQHIARRDVVKLKILKLTQLTHHKVSTTDSPDNCNTDVLHLDQFLADGSLPTLAIWLT